MVHEEPGGEPPPVTGLPAPRLLDLRDGGHGRPRQRDEGAALIGEAGAGAVAVEQADAEMPLELGDLGRDRRLAEAQPRGGATEAEVLRDREEGVQMVKLHEAP